MFKRSNLWYSVPPILLLCVFVATFTLVHSQNANYSNYEALLAENRATTEMYETIQMLPATQRVLLLSTETLDESFRKLGEYDDGQYFNPGYEIRNWGIPPIFHVLLSNRRTIKILQEFEKLPPDQAKIKAKKFHEIALDSLSKALDKVPIAVFPDGGYGIVRQDELYMALTSLLLSASLGDVPFLMQQIEDWEQTITNKIRSNEKTYAPKLAETLLRSPYFFPDPTSLVSILMFAMERKGGIPEVMKSRIAETDCTIADIPLVAWNAYKTYYDYRRQGISDTPISWGDTQLFFRVYEIRCDTEDNIRASKELVRFLKEMMAAMN